MAKRDRHGAGRHDVSPLPEQNAGEPPHQETKTLTPYFAAIGETLRAQYASILNEPLPERLLDLMRRLEHRQD